MIYTFEREVTTCPSCKGLLIHLSTSIQELESLEYSIWSETALYKCVECNERVKQVTSQRW